MTLDEQKSTTQVDIAAVHLSEAAATPVIVTSAIRRASSRGDTGGVDFTFELVDQATLRFRCLFKPGRNLDMAHVGKYALADLCSKVFVDTSRASAAPDGPSPHYADFSSPIPGTIEVQAVTGATLFDPPTNDAPSQTGDQTFVVDLPTTTVTQTSSESQAGALTIELKAMKVIQHYVFVRHEDAGCSTHYF